MDSVIAYVTAPKLEEAKSLGKALLEEKLAACVNIIDSMTSLYFWEGELAEDKEVVMIIKTRASKFDQVVEFIKERHSYSVPCVLKLEVKGGNEGYLQWLAQQC